MAALLFGNNGVFGFLYFETARKEKDAERGRRELHSFHQMLYVRESFFIKILRRFALFG